MSLGERTCRRRVQRVAEKMSSAQEISIVITDLLTNGGSTYQEIAKFIMRESEMPENSDSLVSVRTALMAAVKEGLLVRRDGRFLLNKDFVPGGASGGGVARRSPPAAAAAHQKAGDSKANDDLLCRRCSDPVGPARSLHSSHGSTNISRVRYSTAERSAGRPLKRRRFAKLLKTTIRTLRQVKREQTRVRRVLKILKRKSKEMHDTRRACSDLVRLANFYEQSAARIVAEYDDITIAADAINRSISRSIAAPESPASTGRGTDPASNCSSDEPVELLVTPAATGCGRSVAGHAMEQ